MNHNKRSDTSQEIDITFFLSVLWKYKFLLIALVIIGAAIMYVRATYFTADTYTSYGIIYVSSLSSASDNDNTSTSEEAVRNISSSRALATSYIETLKTYSFLSEVSEEIGGKYSSAALKGLVSITQVNETELLQITVTTGNPDDSYNIVKAVIDKSPEKLSSVFKGGEISTVDEAIYPNNPNDKKINYNMGVGALVGLIFGIGLVYIINVLDKKVRKSEDVANRYGVFILGELAD